MALRYCRNAFRITDDSGPAGVESVRLEPELHDALEKRAARDHGRGSDVPGRKQERGKAEHECGSLVGVCLLVVSSEHHVVAPAYDTERASGGGVE